MRIKFVTEAVMLAIYGNLLDPEKPVEYVIPSTTISELYELLDSDEAIMPEPNEDQQVRASIRQLLEFFENPFTKKTIEQSTVKPWRKSTLLTLNSRVSVSVIHAVDTEQYGEDFDPIETELVLSAQVEKAPLLTDQPDLIERIIQAGIPTVVVDIEDFEYVVEEGLEGRI